MINLIILPIIYIIGFLYYEKQYKIPVYNKRYNLYYIKKITLYQLLENSDELKINFGGWIPCIIKPILYF